MESRNIKPEDYLEISIKSLEAYRVAPEVINSMLSKLKMMTATNVKTFKITLEPDGSIKTESEGMSIAEMLGVLKIAHTKLTKELFDNEKDTKRKV